jgi:hypothetical protein
MAHESSWTTMTRRSQLVNQSGRIRRRGLLLLLSLNLRVCTRRHDTELDNRRETRRVGGWTPKILARYLQNEDVDLAIRSKGGSEQVAAEISFLSSRR